MDMQRVTAMDITKEWMDGKSLYIWVEFYPWDWSPHSQQVLRMRHVYGYDMNSLFHCEEAKNWRLASHIMGNVLVSSDGDKRPMFSKSIVQVSNDQFIDIMFFRGSINTRLRIPSGWIGETGGFYHSEQERREVIRKMMLKIAKHIRWVHVEVTRTCLPWEAEVKIQGLSWDNTTILRDGGKVDQDWIGSGDWITNGQVLLRLAARFLE